MLTLGRERTKELVLGVSEMTAFLSLLYSGAREGDFLDIVKKALFFLISWIISMDNHRRFHLLGNEALGMHLYMISRKALHQSFQEILGLLSTRMSEWSG